MASFFVPGNTAVITGGASGIGLAIAKKCVSHGMKVLVVDRDTKLLQAAKKVLGETSATFELDVSLLQDWETLKTEVNTSIGGTFLLSSILLSPWLQRLMRSSVPRVNCYSRTH